MSAGGISRFSRPGLRALLLRWLDPALAVVFLIAVEAQIFASSYRRGPLVANAVLAAAIAGALALRRRWPLVFVVWSLGLAVVMSAFLTHVPDLVSATYLVFIPAYTVAAWLDSPRTITGLIACVALLIAVAAASGGIGLADIVFEGFGATGAWALGRLMRSRRALSEALSRQAAQIVADREDRARLALADERTRIARELQAVVAASVSDMIVGAQAAERLLERDAAAADAAIASIEQIGRQALGDMRRILGVLRDQDTAALAPQPGVGQLYTLVEHARSSGCDVELRVEGEPAPLPARVDLAIYRIVQELLSETALDSGAVAIGLDYVPDQVNLHVTRPADAVSTLPAATIQERVALCGGALETSEAAGRIELHARLPTTFDPVPA
jgi:signal transduction histidine kinase